MSIYKIDSLADILSSNTYPGRGIVIGKTPDGTKAAIAYFIMGRSENSRNRIFKEEAENVTIYPYDASKVEDPSLIIYSPLKVFENKLIVTNGDQTDTVYDFLADGKTFEEALNTREFEPDAPNFTPRISGELTFGDSDFTYKMSILKSADEIGSACSRYTYCYNSLAGLGHFIHTYKCDGNPIPSFDGEPERVVIPDTIEDFAEEVWQSLNADNKVSLFVRCVPLDGSAHSEIIINKNI